MTELASMRHVVGAEQNADISVKLRLLALSGTTWATGLAMLGQVPPQLFVHTFFGIYVAVDCFLTDAQFGAFIDHPIANLFRRPTLFDPCDHSFANLGMSDQLALDRAAVVRLKLCSVAEVTGIL